MRLEWSRRAQAQMRAIREFSPAQAARVAVFVERIAPVTFPDMFPAVRGRPGVRVIYVPTTNHGVYYRVRGEVMRVMLVCDLRRWW